MMTNRTARRSRAALLTLMLLTSACASVPNLGPKPMPRAASDYAASQSLAGNSAEWPAEGWWTSYGDPQLAQFIDEGLAGSPDLAAAAARVRTAQGLAQAAGAKLLPSLDASASVTTLNPSNNLGFPVWNGFKEIGNAGLSLNFDLDLWEHRAPYNGELDRIEMWLFSRADQFVTLPTAGCHIAFRKGEGIHTENSHKYTSASFAALAAAAGLAIQETWTDPRGWFASFLLRPEGVAK